ncbi:MAG: type IV toxin-antitoxin system AbiEi family antitoxin [Acidobacteriota bacterium]|nr:type IV toxin-antitoxin system AbiEi family antitoxin [Acidobacteriota bacterium]
MGQLEFDGMMLDRTLAAIEAETGLSTAILGWELQIGRDGQRADAVVEITRPEGKTRFAVEIKNTIRWGTVEHLLHRWHLAAEERLLIVVPYITPQIAHRCRDIGVCFADTAGNMFLRAPGLHVYVLGRRPPETLQAADEGRAVTPAGLRIVFALLCNFHLLNAPYREIHTAARAALGTVGPVIKDLEIRKHLTLGTAKRRILDPDRLLEEWIAAFPTVLRPKLNARRFRAPDPNWVDHVDIVRYHGYWGGEVAAKKLLDYLQPVTTTIYVTEMPRQLIIDHRLRADINGDVEILDVFWNTQRIHGIRDVVPPVLAYADLLTTTDGRDIEAARMIYDQFIRPTFRNQAFRD